MKMRWQLEKHALHSIPQTEESNQWHLLDRFTHANQELLKNPICLKLMGIVLLAVGRRGRVARVHADQICSLTIGRPVLVDQPGAVVQAGRGESVLNSGTC